LVKPLSGGQVAGLMQSEGQAKLAEKIDVLHCASRHAASAGRTRPRDLGAAFTLDHS
jgi:hypothetical protein